MLQAYQNEFISPLLLFFIDPFPTISPMCEVSWVQENAIIDNHDNHMFSSLDTSPTSEEGILVLEDSIIERNENLVCFSPPTSPTWEDIFGQEDENIDTFVSK